jgi:hypothetical protein
MDEDVAMFRETSARFGTNEIMKELISRSL